MGDGDYYIVRAHIVSRKVLNLYQQLASISKQRTLILFDMTSYSKSSVQYDDKVSILKEECKLYGYSDVDVYRFNEVITDYDKDKIVFVTITEDECANINRLHNTGSQQGSLYKIEAQILGMYSFLNSNQHVYTPLTNMWYIEYDVHCHGEMSKVIEQFDNVRADLLVKGSDTGNEIRTRTNEPYWDWWNSGLEGEIANISPEHQRGCFLPLMRISKVFLNCLKDNVGINSGFCEIYFPTLCHINGLVLKAFPESIFCTFRYRANLDITVIDKMEKEHLLFHPLKSM